MAQKLTLDDLRRALQQVLAELRGDDAPQDTDDEAAINALFAPQQETP